MRKVFISVLAVAFMAFAGNTQETKIKKEDKLKAKPAVMKDKDMKMKGMDKDMVYPYKATYSSQFAPGKPAQAKVILDMWKDWDDNTLDRQANYFADTAMMEFANGYTIKGKENILKESRDFRSRYTSMKSSVEVWMPMRSIDRNEDWVLIWGVEESTDKEGKTTKQRLHEVWGFNKDGKISYMRNYTAQLPKEPSQQLPKQE